MTSGYREFAPPEQLAMHVACFWTERTGPSTPDRQTRILPDGCMDIVWIGDRAPVIVGPATRADLPVLPPHAIITGVRFRPGMAPSLLGVPADELRNAEVLLRDVWRDDALSLAARVSEVESMPARLAAAEGVVRSRLSAACPVDSLVSTAATWLMRDSTTRVHEVSEHLGVSERQLLRRFAPAVGYGPKTFHRVARFQRWLQLTKQCSRTESSLAGLAAAAGYADQSHLTREVTRLAGLSPAALLSDE